jgi:hypothetical protein
MILFALAFFICAWVALLFTLFYISYNNTIALEKPADTLENTALLNLNYN